jgi:hypothetical protein
MKTKLFSLFIAVFFLSFSSNAQITAKTSAFPVISLIGAGSPFGNWADDTDLSTLDGETYTYVDMQLSTADVKFRQDHSWATFGFGPVLSTDTGWPSGANPSPVDGGPNIKAQAGVWNVTFIFSTKSWTFTPGTPNPVIKLVGTAATATPITMDTKNGTLYTAKKVTLVPGTLQFDVKVGSAPNNLYGGLIFPAGAATDPAQFIPVTTTGIDYDVTFDYTTGNYTFVVATFPKIALIGGGTLLGWPADPQVDGNAMTTVDGITYKLQKVQLIGGPVKFRQDNNWANNWGGSTWPSGVTAGSDIPAVAGWWNVTFNKTTGAYAFTPYTISIIGDYNSWGNDDLEMATTDGLNYTRNIELPLGKVKFRENHDWAKSWGGGTFPSGPTAGQEGADIIVTSVNGGAGWYAASFNSQTAVYNFVSIASPWPVVSVFGTATAGADVNMHTLDGVTYTLKGNAYSAGNVIFREAANSNTWGNVAFPTGTATAGGTPIAVPAGATLDVTFNRTTGVYTFSFLTISLTGDANLGWNNSLPGVSDMYTSDGVNYVIQSITLTNGGGKFLQGHGWSPSWSTASWPSGTGTGSGGNIPVVAGTYGVTINIVTGVYNFGAPLAVKNFNATSFKAYPNPTKTSWNIVSGNDDITSVQVFDMLGKSVYAKTAASKEVTVNATELSNGVYFAKVSTANGSSTVKLVKE